MDAASLIACHECDLLLRAPPPQRRSVARCGRCGALLFRSNPRGIDTTLALAITGLVLFVVSNVFPLFHFEMQGLETKTTLLAAVAELSRQHHLLIAIVVAATAVFVPLLRLIALVYLLAPLKIGRVPPQAAVALRLLRLLQPWGMMEVFMLGALVSVAKLAGMANVSPGIALWSFGALIFVLAGAAASLDVRAIWRLVPAR